MAAGTFTTGTLSVRNIQSGYYSSSSGGIREAGGDTLTLSAPYKIGDFKGLPYCRIVSNDISMKWGGSESGSFYGTTATLTINPDQTFTIYSKPSWIGALCNQTNNTTCLYPTSTYSSTRTGNVYICTTSGSYTVETIFVCQCDDFVVT